MSNSKLQLLTAKDACIKAYHCFKLREEWSLEHATEVINSEIAKGLFCARVVFNTQPNVVPWVKEQLEAVGYKVNDVSKGPKEPGCPESAIIVHWC